MRNIYYRTMMSKLAGSTPFAHADDESGLGAANDVLSKLNGAVFEIQRLESKIQKDAKAYEESFKKGDEKTAGIIGAAIIAALGSLGALLAHRSIAQYTKSPEIQRAIAREEALLRSKKYADLPSLLSKLAKFRVSLKDKVKALGQKIKQGFSTAKAKVKGFFGLDSAFMDRVVHDAMNRRLALYKRATQIRRRCDSFGRVRYVLDDVDQFGFEEIGPQAQKSGKNWLKASAATLLLSGVLGTLVILVKKQPDVFKRIYEFVKTQIANIKNGTFKGKISDIKNKVLQMINAARNKIDQFRTTREVNELLNKTQKLRDSKVRSVARKIDRYVQRCIDSTILSTLKCRRNDVIGTTALIIGAIKFFVIPWLMKCLTSAVVGSMTASLKSKVFDPLVSKLLARFKSFVQNKDPNDTYLKAFWNGIKNDFLKVIELLKKEGSPIAAKLKQGFDKVKNFFSRRGDSRRMLMAY